MVKLFKKEDLIRGVSVVGKLKTGEKSI